MYTVIGGAASRTFRVLWMLEELGVPYDHLPVRSRAAEVVAHNPSGKVPVLLVDGEAISDSTAILTYLADRHQALTNDPGTLDRARQDSLTFCVLDELESLLWLAARHTFVLPEAERMPGIKSSLKLEYTRNIARLGERLCGPYLMGEMMTIPDIVLTHCCNWAATAGFPDPGEAFAPYLSKVRARPAYGRAMALRNTDG